MKNDRYPHADPTYYDRIGYKIDKFRKYNLFMSYRELAAEMNISVLCLWDHIHGRTAWKKKDVERLVALGMPLEYFSDNKEAAKK